MWPFKHKPQSVTTDQFTAALLELLRRSSKKLCAELEKQTAEWKLDPDEVDTLETQVFIASLWVVSKVLGRDTKILDLLHEGYLSGYKALGGTDQERENRVNAARSELEERYDAYYKIWDENEPKGGEALGATLSFEMAQFFYPRHRPVKDPVLQLMIASHMLAFMTGVTEIAKKFEILNG
jgi:hypothetical protein